MPSTTRHSTRTCPLPAPRRQEAPRPAVTAPPADEDGELPPGMTPAEWLARRHVVSIARKAVGDPVSTNYVPVERSEEPQLVLTPRGFRMVERFEHLEIRREV